MRIGNNFSANRNCSICAREKISFGNDVLLAFNIIIRDSDGHSIKYSETGKSNKCQHISIGNHVWLCAHSTILKGCFISDDSVVGFGSICSSYCSKARNELIVGNPAKCKRVNIRWEF